MLQPSTPFSKAHLHSPAKSLSALRLLGLLVGLLLLSHLSARADSGLYKDFIILQTGGTTTYYYTYTGIAVPNPAFQNANLGIFDPAAATPGLILNGAEANTYEGNGAVMQAARLFYRVYEEGTVPGLFVPIELAYRYAGIDGNPNNKKWDRTDAGIDLVQAAGRVGRFVLEAYFQSDVSYAGSTFQNYDSNNAANYRATFTVGQTVQPYVGPSNAEVDNNFRTYVTQVFGNLEPNRVTTGLLVDYGFEFANPRIYDGVLLEDSTVMDPGMYADLYKTLYTSRFNTNAAGMRHPSIHDSLCYIAREREVITLSGLLFKYNAIDPQARANGAIQTINEQLQDQYINGIWQNPYQELTTVAISPSTVYYNLTSCQVKLPSSLFLSNIANQISNVQLDADNGQGYQPIPFDTPLPLTYATTGWKHWLFKVTLTNGQQLISHSKIHIDSTSNIAGGPALPRGSGTSGASARGFVVDARVPITASEAYLGRFGVADVVISYRDASDRVLRRPLIVAEGFDPGHILTPEEPEGQNTFDSFVTRADNSGSNALRDLISDNPSEYDIVYVNWRNGTDYLQRNALVLEEVIRWVNANKQPLGTLMQPNVVLGSSMGGVIARMALGRMDRAGGVAAHQTRLYVSVDAPHQGANVPLGYQAAARHAGRMYIGSGPIGAVVEIVQFVRNGPSPLLSALLADQPASKQILINRLNLLDQLANTTHQQFQNELRTTWAYPVNVRNVAISNGSECAIDQEFAPGSALLYHYRSVKTRFLSDLIGMAAGAGLGALGVPLPFAAPLVIPGSSKFELTLDIKSLANGGGNRVYYGNVKYTKKILWLVPVTINIVNHSYTAPGGLLPLDTYPGGFYTLTLDALPGAVSRDWAFTYNNNFFVQRRFGYIPTASAIDIGQGNSTLGANEYLARYVGATPPAAPLNSPFANFTTAFNQTRRTARFDNDNQRVINNEPHESFSLRSGRWLAAELNGAPTQTNCTEFCGSASYVINGPASICTSDTYTIAGLPAGATVQWVAQPAGILTNSFGSSPAFQATANTSGNVTLRATIFGDCGEFVVTRTIYVGAPPAAELQAPSGLDGCNTFAGSFQITNLNPAFTYSVSAGGSLRLFGGFNASTGTIGVKVGAQAGPGYVTVVTQSACGSTPSSQTIDVPGCTTGNRFAVYPNPAQDETTVENQAAPTESFDVALYNGQGKLVYEKRAARGKVRLSLRGLPPGLYHLHTGNGRQKETRNLQITQ